MGGKEDDEISTGEVLYNIVKGAFEGSVIGTGNPLLVFSAFTALA
jgi:hypothetical protein